MRPRRASLARRGGEGSRVERRGVPPRGLRDGQDRSGESGPGTKKYTSRYRTFELDAEFGCLVPSVGDLFRRRGFARFRGRYTRRRLWGRYCSVCIRGIPFAGHSAPIGAAGRPMRAGVSDVRPGGSGGASGAGALGAVGRDPLDRGARGRITRWVLISWARITRWVRGCGLPGASGRWRSLGVCKSCGTRWVQEHVPLGVDCIPICLMLGAVVRRLRSRPSLARNADGLFRSVCPADALLSGSWATTLGCVPVQVRGRYTRRVPTEVPPRSR